MPSTVASASTKAAIGPLPVPAIVRDSPPSRTVASIVLAPSTVESVTTLTSSKRPHGACRVRQVLVLEPAPQLGGSDLATVLVDAALDDTGELDLQPARQVHLVLGLHDVGDAALAGLAVDADDGLVGPAHVVRVDGQVGHAPDEVVDARAPSLASAVHRLEALLDGVLVRAGEGGEDEVAAVGVALAAPAAGCSTRRCGAPRRCR